ncbi:GH15353 [Drosophila grimshawi]|uniref:GH15353 n=1 Tax=Drosophila grimshawi TaxID=7222 RepID=B4J3I6_DROGR|nr:GH15353 [Drosophila grimshawi]
MTATAILSSSNNNNNNLPFEKDKIWYFSTEQLTNSPSRRCGIKCDDELHYRQMTAYLIQEMGQRLQVSQLCINTAIVYMHRFYAFHSFTHFHRNSMASASLFLAAKVEEQPRKLEHVIRAANKCLPQTSEQTYADLAQELVFNENVLLQTLGFDVAIDHPHTHVVRTCQLVKACKDLAQTSYFLASNSLHLTSMCLQYRPTVVACFCIYLACKWSRWEIPQSTEGKHWFYYVDKSVSLDLLKQLTDEFIAIYEKSPARLKSKLNSIKAIAQGASNRTAANSKDNKPKEDWKMSEMMKGYHSNITAPPELMNGSDSRDSSSSSSSQAALLPPPTMVPPQQRRGGGGVPGNSSSSTSSSSSSNHKMPNYPGGLPPEAHGDHKSKQAGYSSRPPSSASAQRGSSVGGPSSSSSSGNSQRSSSSSSQPGSIRPPMPMDYHKSSRGMQPPVGGGMQAHGGHKISTSSKPQQPPPPLLDSRSSSSSSASSGASAAGIPSKDGSKSSSSSKMYPNAPPSYSNSGASNQLMSRGGYQSSSSGGGAGVGAPGGSNGAPSSSSSSVHSMPPYEQQLPYGQSQSVPPNYNHMQQQQQQQQMPPPEAATQPQLSKNNSLFSPEWNDIKKESQFNGLLPPPDSLGYKLSNHARDRDSPKKDRLTPTKKDKHRSTLPHSSSNSSNSNSNSGNSSSSSSSAPKTMLPPPPHKKSHGEMLASTGELGNSNLKRANEMSGSQYGLNKMDEHDGSLPRDKVRKVDTGVNLAGGYPSYEDKHVPLSMTNGGGIETTPDLVRSLLKASLCTTNASLLKPDALTMPGLKPPIELLEPMPPTPPLHMKKESLGTPINLMASSNLTAPSSMELGALTKLDGGGGSDGKDLDGVGKSEKKKKKDKHKHKEKDKSKDKPDKEERKKHKKDKQKERSSSKDNSMDSLKLVIKTNTATDNPNGAAAPLKLKISKNKVEPNNYSAAAGLLAMPTAAPTTGFGMAPPAITPVQPAPYGGGYSSSNSNSSSSHSTSGKKKHSDRDRDKDSKKSKTQDYAKYNGVGGAYPPLGGAGAASQLLAAPVSNLLGLPANMTTASSTPNTMLMAPTGIPTSAAVAAAIAGGIGGIAPPPALPVYNKK